MSMDDLNGLNVGDLIYNEDHTELFIVELFTFERSANVGEDPYILGRRIIVGDKSILIDSKQTHVSIHGSRRFTQSDVSAMITRHLEEYNNKLQGLGELYKMAGPE